jgi:nucleotide-binding universal stress UspA family protein
MTYKTVMVSLSIDQSNEAVLEIAGQLAEQFDAKLIGIAASAFSPPPYFLAGTQAQSFIDEGERAIRKSLSEMEGVFRAAIKGRAKDVEWRSALEIPARYVANEARAADIIVTAGAGDAIGDPFTAAGPSDLLMQAARPLLVVPATVRWLDLRSVLVAWKDGLEARRAVADALPMLHKAKEVVVAAVAEEEGGQAAALRQVDDVVSWLSRHGILATGLAPESSGNVAVQLDRIASDVGAGVVVAGAYGHSRFREWILGGVTQQLVGQQLRCSLLSR